MDMEAMKKLKETAEKCVAELSKKNDLSPSETRAAVDGLQLINMLDYKIEESKIGEEYSERGYSRHHQPMRMMYPEDSYRGYSGDYGIQGWYQNGNGSYENRSYGNQYGESMSMNSSRGYSRHSISDRAVEKLEHLMDMAGSEYERQELKRYIGMIRQAGMTD